MKSNQHLKTEAKVFTDSGSVDIEIIKGVKWDFSFVESNSSFLSEEEIN